MDVLAFRAGKEGRHGRVPWEHALVLGGMTCPAFPHFLRSRWRQVSGSMLCACDPVELSLWLLGWSLLMGLPGF